MTTIGTRHTYLTTLGDWVDRNPVGALIGGWFILSFAFIQHDYGYLLLRHRLKGGELPEIVFSGLVVGALLVLLVPVAWSITTRVRAFTDQRYVYAVHVLSGLVLAWLHAELLSLATMHTLVEQRGIFEKSAIFTVVVYVSTVLYAERRRMEAWIRDRQLASEKMVAAIYEEKVRAERLRLDPDQLADELDVLELCVVKSPDQAEEMVTSLAERLRRLLQYIRRDITHDGLPSNNSMRIAVAGAQAEW